MDSRYIKDNQVIDRYLMNKLSADELETFERYFLERPDLVSEIELRKQFIRGIRRIDSADTLQPAGNESAANRRSLRGSRRLYTAAATAVSVALLIAAGLFYLQTVRLQNLNDLQARQIDLLSKPQVNTMLVPLGHVRGAGAEPAPVVRIQLSAAAERLILVLSQEPLGFEKYRLSLKRQDAGELWNRESDNIPPAVIVPANLLSPGDYHLVILGLSGTGESTPAAEFSFTVLSN